MFFIFCFGKQKPRPCKAEAGVIAIKLDYFLRRNSRSEAPPRAASAIVPGSGTGTRNNGVSSELIGLPCAVAGPNTEEPGLVAVLKVVI